MPKNMDFGTKIKEIRYKYEIFLKIRRMQKTKEFGAINYFTRDLFNDPALWEQAPPPY